MKKVKSQKWPQQLKMTSKKEDNLEMKKIWKMKTTSNKEDNLKNYDELKTEDKLKKWTILVWFGLDRSNSAYKAISASQQSWSSGLAELGKIYIWLWLIIAASVINSVTYKIKKRLCKVTDPAPDTVIYNIVCFPLTSEGLLVFNWETVYSSFLSVYYSYALG